MLLYQSMVASLSVPASRGGADFFFVGFVLLRRIFFKASALVYTPVRLGAQMLTPHYPRRATDEAAKRLPGSFSFVFNRLTAVAAVLVAVEFS